MRNFLYDNWKQCHWVHFLDASLMLSEYYLKNCNLFRKWLFRMKFTRCCINLPCFTPFVEGYEICHTNWNTTWFKVCWNIPDNSVWKLTNSSLLIKYGLLYLFIFMITLESWCIPVLGWGVLCVRTLLNGYAFECALRLSIWA